MEHTISHTWETNGRYDMGMKAELAEEISQKFINQLEQGVVPWKKPWSPTAGCRLQNYYSKRPYRVINVLLLGLASMESGYESPAWTTYKAAADKGAQVRKGEKATRIVYWGRVDKIDKATGEDASFFMCKMYNVFNTDQIDGIEWVTPDLGEPISVPAALSSIYENYPNAPKLTHSEQDQAFYRPSTDAISLPLIGQFATVEGYAETLCHELTHSTGHPSRLKRFEINDAACKSDYAKEELVAEIGASMMMQAAGISVDMPAMADYIKGWLGALKNDHSLIVSAAQAAQKAMDHIMAPVAEMQEEEAA
jgi:antirestriction protein ArdC